MSSNLLTLLLLLSLQTMYTLQIDYTKIPSSCKRDLCSDRTDFEHSHPTSCECHQSCRHYGDCCRDSPFFKPGGPPYNFSCVTLSSPPSFIFRKMIASCPAEATAEEHQLCVTLNEEDPILSLIPITITMDDNATLVFRNIHCVRCNNVNPLQYKLWSAKFQCSSSSVRIVDKPVTNNKVEWDKQKYKWMYTEDGKIAECNMVFFEDQEEILNYRHRQCEDVVDECPAGWRSSAEVSKLCKSYTALLHYGRATYKNPFCFICHGGDPKKACPRRGIGIGWGKPELTPPIIAHGDSGGGFTSVIFFERGIDTLFKVDNNYQCLRSSAHDTAFNTCRELLIRSTGRMEETRIDTCNATILEKEVFYASEDNKTVTVPQYGRNYTQGMFRIANDGRLIICEDDIPDQPQSTYKLLIGITTVVGFSLSIIFLVVHLCAVALFLELRNLAGMNLASLCLALLGSYISFIAGNFLQSSEPVTQHSCYTVAILTYYFFMAAFFWMFIMAFDVFRVLRASSRRFQVTNGFKRRRFAVYSITAWGCPILLAVVAYLIDISQTGSIDERFRPKFGLPNCWFGSIESLMVLFVIPLALVMTLNISFFVYAAFITSEDPSGHRKHLRICFKLTVMLGLTWAMGLLASMLKIEILWVVFSVLNTLQGLFIFISFTLTPKVAQALSSRFTCVRRSRYTSKVLSSKTPSASDITINMVLSSSSSSSEGKNSK